MNLTLYVVMVEGNPTFTTDKNTEGRESDYIVVDVSENNGNHEPMAKTTSFSDWPGKVWIRAKEFAIELAKKDPNFKP